MDDALPSDKKQQTSSKNGMSQKLSHRQQYRQPHQQMGECMKRVISATAAILMAVGLAACNKAPAPNPNIDLAKAWVTAGNTSRAAAMEMIEQNMADDGLSYRDRYVGFGFIWDNQRGADEGRMIVTNVIADSPVSDVLQAGDEFVSVGGVAVSAENMERLPFRGKPGESVAAVISRDGEEIAIEVSRGVVSAPTTKAEMLEWMASANDEDWGPEKWELHEAVGQGNVVYVWTQAWNTDEASGLPFESHQVTRMMFNDAGQVQAIANLSEDRFVLEQMGYTISR